MGLLHKNNNYRENKSYQHGGNQYPRHSLNESLLLPACLFLCLVHNTLLVDKRIIVDALGVLC